MKNVVLINPDPLARQLQSRYLQRRGFSVTEVDTADADHGEYPTYVVDCTVAQGAARAESEHLAGPDMPCLVLAIVPGERERFALQRRVGRHVEVLVEADGQNPLLDRCCDEIARADETIAQWSRFSVHGLLRRIWYGLRRVTGASD